MRLSSSPPRGTELGLPEFARYGMEGEAEGIAMPDAVDLRKVSGLADEGIVGWNRAVVTNAQNLADVGGRILRELAVVAVAAGDVEEAGFIKRQARAVTVAVVGALSATALGGARSAEPRIGDEERP